jgi:hypothetical protein
MPEAATPTPEHQRRALVQAIALAFLATLVWCFAMFWARVPALSYFCIFALTPMFLAGVWVILGAWLLSLLWRYPHLRQARTIAVTAVAFLLAPYCLLRAGTDMFTLSLRYHLARAGGAEKVQAAFNHWVANRPVIDEGDGRRLLFRDIAPDGSVVPVPETQYPLEVRYISDRFPSRFGFIRGDVAYIDNVSVFTTTYIAIGPPGWEPEGGITLWNRVLGSERKIADGIWVAFGTYDK